MNLKVMFVSYDMNPNKKKFPKPNILRKKSVLNKALSARTTNKHGSQGLPSLLTSSFIIEPKNNELSQEKVENSIESVSSNSKSVLNVENAIEVTGNILEMGENVCAGSDLLYIDNAGDINTSEQTVNVEPFLFNDTINQNIPVFDNNMLQNTDKDNQVKQRWCLEWIQDNKVMELVNTKSESLYVEQNQPPNAMEPFSKESQICQETELLQSEILIPVKNSQDTSSQQFIRTSDKFKCDTPGCNKEFMSKQKLNKHMSIHKKTNNTRPQRHTSLECPVKKIHEDGSEEPCGRIFPIKEELMKHLNENHTIDDAFYSCTECSRRFFWASGLRAHARAHLLRAGRVELACPWPGCARVFSQPCRLREHSRAHTGDRPYPCQYPNCGWSFRTASKLLRHARRHTGDRRHACAACGRAFMRREHLRDHASRHQEPHTRPAHACPHAGCQQSFTNMSSLYMHIKKVHKNVQQEPPAAASEITQIKADNMLIVSLLEPSESVDIDRSAIEVDGIEAVVQEEEEEGHSARTHCTWPLPSRAMHYQHNDTYVLEEDVQQVEQTEGSESNLYTVRSDLFLHGNVLHNEDSEQMAQCEGEVEALALGADLLLDAPSVHLDQEELYTDAVDESSFRVFLFSGEELT